jgi:hypothetical protein
MDSGQIVIKTALGADEVKSRSRKLPQRLRTMLVMIDGSMNVAQLQAAAATLGVPSDFLDELQRQGFVAPKGAGERIPDTVSDAQSSDVDRFRVAQRFMNDTVVDALGFRAFFFTLKLERCFNLADLRALLDDYDKAIRKGIDPDVATFLSGRARQLIA